jgi:hypothetical protein
MGDHLVAFDTRSESGMLDNISHAVPPFPLFYAGLKPFACPLCLLGHSAPSIKQAYYSYFGVYPHALNRFHICGLTYSCPFQLTALPAILQAY